MSLGMDFARRRMMAAEKKGPKYVWAVYAFAYVRDEATATTGSFSATRTRTKMAASAYTVNEGGFTLTGATSTSLQNLQVGQFIVDIGTTSNSTETSGEYLYEITGKSGSYTVTIQYTRYSVGVAKGDTEINRVESDTLDYPIDGEQDGLWYVMLRGEKPVYVWDVYTPKYTYGYKEKTNGEIGRKLSSTTYSATSYTFDTETGYYTLKNPTLRTNLNTVSGLKTAYENKYYMIENATSGTIMWYISSWSDAYLENCTFRKYSRTTDTNNAQLDGRGDATGDIVESSDINAYPQDGVQGDYWYTYSHSYMAEFDDR